MLFLLGEVFSLALSPANGARRRRGEAGQPTIRESGRPRVVEHTPGPWSAAGVKTACPERTCERPRAKAPGLVIRYTPVRWGGHCSPGRRVAGIRFEVEPQGDQDERVGRAEMRAVRVVKGAPAGLRKSLPGLLSAAGGFGAISAI